MKFYILFLGSILSAITFLSSFPVNHITQQESFSLKDSLEKYTNAESKLIVFDSDSSYATLFIGKVEKHSYAVWMDNDTIFTLFQKPNSSEWVATDTINIGGPFSFAKAEDLNGDNYADLKISSLNGMADNTENRVFMFDTSTKTFKLNDFYSLTNIKYNKDGKFIQSSWFSGAVHCQDKKKYDVKGNSLTFNMGITFCPNEDDGGKTGTLELYKLVSGKRVTVKSESGESGKLWSEFDSIFWNSENDMGGE